jgi:AcrR family transcriptional regulator
MSKISSDIPAGQRGPADHAIREQIVAAADEHFARYGYGKTTVADLASAIGFSKAYIYKFFDSKQAIGQAICTRCLDSAMAAALAAIEGDISATEKLRRLFRALIESSQTLFFSERKLYDITAHSYLEKWPSSVTFAQEVLAILKRILLEGRATGEFERKTPIDEVGRAIFLAMQPFVNPIMLQYNLDAVPEGTHEVVNLILRSLAP